MSFSALACHVDVRTNGSSFGTQFLKYVSFCAFYFVCKLTYVDLWMSVNRTMSITSFPRVIPPYRCDEMDATSMRRIEKQMCAHPHVRLCHESKDTSHVRIDTSYIVIVVDTSGNSFPFCCDDSIYFRCDHELYNAYPF